MSEEVRDLIRKMSLANPLWGAPRIHGELLKLGIEVSQATAAKYMARPGKPPSQTWRTFLNNHVKDLVSTDFFVVPTLSFRVLFVFVVLAHHRRRVLHFNVTANPTAEWTAQQMAEAFPWDIARPSGLHASPSFALADETCLHRSNCSRTEVVIKIRFERPAERELAEHNDVV